MYYSTKDMLKGTKRQVRIARATKSKLTIFALMRAIFTYLLPNDNVPAINKFNKFVDRAFTHCFDLYNFLKCRYSELLYRTEKN